MGKRGPSPLPSNVKRLRGTYRSDRAAPNEMAPEVKTPNRPEWLSSSVVPWGREAVREWDRIVPLLEATKVLTELDRSMLATYCDAFGRYWYYRRELAKVGSIQVTESGYRAQQPEASLMKQAHEEMLKLSARFGLTPADRTHVGVPEKKDQPNNPFAMFAQPRKSG